MPPHLRSSYARERRAFLNARGPVNSRGLPALPTELLLEIVSHAPTCPIPLQGAHPLPAIYLERSATLRVLSRLCRSLRRALLPALWERIEACATNVSLTDRPGQVVSRWQRDIATNLINQLETVTIREPSLASYVKVVNVLVTPYSAKTVLVELARCLALMPNLHTVQIFHYTSIIYLPGRRRCVTITDLYRDAFAGHCFPSVRRVLISLGGDVLLPCFPEASQIHILTSRHFQTNSYENKCEWALKHAKKMAMHCPKAQVFEWTRDYETPWAIRKSVYEVLPNLRQVQLSAEHDVIEPIDSFAAFKNLDTIVLIVSEDAEAEDEKKIEQMILAARAILTASPSSERKALIVRRPGGTEVSAYIAKILEKLNE